MSYLVKVPSASAVLTADGNADGRGYATVADNEPFYPGCEARLTNDNGTQRCLITDIKDDDKVGLRFIREDNDPLTFPQPNYGRSDLVDWTTGTNSVLSMPEQYAPVELDYIKPSI